MSTTKVIPDDHPPPTQSEVRPRAVDVLQLPWNTGLLVVDMQQGFDDPRWGRRNNPDAERNVARLLEAWRHASMPVLHVHHDSLSPDGAFRIGTPGNHPKPETAPLASEHIVRKVVNSAFIGTNLEATLRQIGIGAIVIVGLTTNHCVSTTARMAANLGFKTIVVCDATATFERATIEGRMRSADEVHEAALSDLAGEFATIIGFHTLLEAVSHHDRSA